MNATIELLHSILPSTVGLKATIPAGHASAPILGTERMGSGTIIDDGLVLTANYVAVGAQSIEVCFLDNVNSTAELVAQDFYSGLAVLRLSGAGYPKARIKSSEELAPGHEVFIAASAGESQRRINTGAITTVQPFDAFWEFRLERAITTTIMNPGLGGGGLFGMDGALCGIVSLDLNEIGHFTLAIPTEYFSRYREEFLEHGRRTSRAPRAWIGLYCYTVDDHVAIAGILPGSPAERSGLKAGDLILSVGGSAIRDRSALYESIWKSAPGDEVAIQVYSGNDVREVRVASDDAERFFA